ADLAETRCLAGNQGSRGRAPSQWRARDGDPRASRPRRSWRRPAPAAVARPPAAAPGSFPMRPSPAPLLPPCRDSFVLQARWLIHSDQHLLITTPPLLIISHRDVSPHAKIAGVVWGGVLCCGCDNAGGASDIQRHIVNRGQRVIERQTDHTEYMQFEALSAYSQVAHAVFTRRRGFSVAPYAGLNGSVTTGDDLATVRRNRRAVSDAIGLPLTWAKPVHGTDAVFIDRAFAGDAPDDPAAFQRMHDR